MVDLQSHGVDPTLAKQFTQTINSFYSGAVGGSPTKTASISGLGGQSTGVVVGGKTTTLPDVQQGTAPTASGGGAGGGGTTNPGGLPQNLQPLTNPAPALNWEAYLADWGFPPDVVSELTRIFTQYTDPSLAQAAALAYIRGTDWYKQTFAGIGAGIKNGVVSNEADYRSYVNQLNQYYQRYYGRNVTTQEVNDFLTSGKSVGAVGAHLQGQAYINANQNEIQYELGAFSNEGRASSDQLNALGDQVGGLDNMVGANVQAKLDLARQKLQRIFQGTLANPSLNVLQSNGGLASSSIAGRTQDYSA